MSQTDQLLDALKRVLRERGLTYADAAGALELSEASVKRLFSQRQFTLERVERLCELARWTWPNCSRAPTPIGCASTRCRSIRSRRWSTIRCCC